MEKRKLTAADYSALLSQAQTACTHSLRLLTAVQDSQLSGVIEQSLINNTYALNRQLFAFYDTCAKSAFPPLSGEEENKEV